MPHTAAAPAEPAARAVDPRAQLVRLCVAGFLAYCSYTICRSPLVPLFARDLGAGPALVGLVVAASTLTGVVLKLPAGAASDVLGRRPLLVAGALIFAATPFAYLAVSTIAGLVALRFVHGSATASFGPVASASLSDIAPLSRRATWLSTYSTVQGAGQALAPILAGYLIAGGGFGPAFLTAGAIALAVPFIAAAWRHERPATPREGRWRQFAVGISEVGRNRLILITSAAQAAQFVLNGTLNGFLPLYGREVLGLTVTQLGFLFGLQTVTTLVSRPLMGIVSDRIGRRGLIAGGLALSSAAVLLVSLAASPIALLGAVVTYAIGVAVTAAATSAFITDLSRRAQYGAAHGVFGTIYDVGDALGPIVAGVLVASVGYGPMFRLMAAGAAAMAAAFWVFSREHPRRARASLVTSTEWREDA